MEQVKTEMEQGKVRKLQNIKRLMAFIVVMTVAFAMSAVCFAEGETSTDPQLSINFDVTQMFDWAQVIINSLMPVVYVVMGLGLGFLIVNNLKRAFMGSVH